MRFAFAAVALLTIGAAGRADDYIQGSDGFFYLNGQAYTRSLVQSAGYYRCGYYYPGSSYYTYALVVNPYPKPPAFTENWRVEAVRFLKAREDRIEYEAFLRAAGLPMNTLYPSTYGQLTGSVSTQTGYNVGLGQTINPFAIDLNQLAAGSLLLAQQGQASADAARGEFTGLTDRSIVASSDLARIAARRDAIVAFSKMINDPPSTQKTDFTLSFKGGALREVAPTPQQAPPATLQERLITATKSCTACHSGAKIEGGFDLAKFGLPGGIDPDLILERISRPVGDPKHMPKDGPMLSSDDRLALFEAASIVRRKSPEVLPVPKK
jgi:hypothetical protein